MVESWDYVHSAAASAARNMAIDEALLRTAAQRSRPLLRIYSWQRPAITIGYFQEFPAHLANVYEIARRPTGGGLVYHGDGVDTTYTVVGPPTHSLYTMGTADAYRVIHQAVVAALGSRSQITDHKSPPPRSSYECFQNPVLGDVVGDGRKLAGGAQRRNKCGMLHQGSIAATVAVDRLQRAFAETFGVTLVEYRLTPIESALADELVEKKYATENWNRRKALVV